MNINVAQLKLALECENHGLGGDSRDNPYVLPKRFAPKPKLPLLAWGETDDDQQETGAGISL